MNNQTLLDNYLMILKGTVEVYVHGTLESSNKDVRELLKNGLDEIMQEQANTYDEMTKYGWYTVNNVEKNVIMQTLTTINSKN